MIVRVYTGNRELKEGYLESRAPPVLLIVPIQSDQRAGVLLLQS